ncbi:MAG: ABC transporter permease [Candidatus Terrybacteria bacterium]|nr:ABC transporter permease [Candidatus Terrybacteria bacterium]
MRASDIILLNVQSFRTRLMRAMLTVGGMSIGIGAVFFLVTLGFGLQQVLFESITTAESLLSLDVASQGDALKLDAKTIEEIASLPNVEEVSPVASLSAQAELQGVATDVVAQLVTPSYFRLQGMTLDFGSPFNEGDAEGVVVSSALLKAFNLEAAQGVGQELALTVFVPQVETEDRPESVRIVKAEPAPRIRGVVADDTTALLFVSSTTLPDVVVPSYQQAKVKVESEEYLNTVRDEILQRGFLVSALSDAIEEANRVFFVLQVVLGIFGVVALLVAAVGMFNTMTISLLERTQDVGIMKAIGASDRDVLFLFLSESFLMGLLGGFGGIGVGYVGGQALNLGLNILARTQDAEPLNVFAYPLWFIASIVALSAVVGFSTGIFPARRAAHLKPLVALRYK